MPATGRFTLYESYVRGALSHRLFRRRESRLPLAWRRNRETRVPLTGTRRPFSPSTITATGIGGGKQEGRVLEGRYARSFLSELRVFLRAERPVQKGCFS